MHFYPLFFELVIDTFFLGVYNSHIERQWSRRKRNDFLRLFFILETKTSFFL